MIPLPVPGKEEVSPEISGRIIDRKTKLPVAGAHVAINEPSWKEIDEPNKRPSAVTDDEGRFHLPADKHFYMMLFVTPCPVYHFPPVGDRSSTIIVSHPDYETLTVSSYDRWLRDKDGKRLPEVGDIEIVTKQ
jgi:hypothetical protein